MSNKEIAGLFNQLSKLVELHGENSFKARAYRTAAFRIDKYPQPLQNTDLGTLSIPGVGDAILKKLDTILVTGHLPLLEKYLEKTPPGVVEMLSIKGIGAKKVAVLWKELDIESLGELSYACEENRLLDMKGFGEKTQKAILENIRFIQKNKGYFLYADVEKPLCRLLSELHHDFPNQKTEITGTFRRQVPVINHVEILTELSKDQITKWLENRQTPITSVSDDLIRCTFDDLPEVNFVVKNDRNWSRLLFTTTNSDDFNEAFLKKFSFPEYPKTEDDIFNENGLIPLPPALREDDRYLSATSNKQAFHLITQEDIHGLIHCHSQFSDGVNTLEDMAKSAQDKGFQYMVISDHSQTAVYAHGMRPETVIRQHQLINELNQQLAPFRIFKGVESDILSDGALDYDETTLSTFDLVIASVHSNLKMDEDKAMRRLLRAIENPYTKILGHMTGRLLLSRPGFPVNHKKLIDACAANGVIIEINAHPRRLDLDWHWIPYAIEKGVLLSINPDAHSIEGMDLIKYGVLAAQKGGLTKESNLSSKTLKEFNAFLRKG